MNVGSLLGGAFAQSGLAIVIRLPAGLRESVELADGVRWEWDVGLVDHVEQVMDGAAGLTDAEVLVDEVTSIEQAELREGRVVGSPRVQLVDEPVGEVGEGLQACAIGHVSCRR